MLIHIAKNQVRELTLRIYAGVDLANVLVEVVCPQGEADSKDRGLGVHALALTDCSIYISCVCIAEAPG